MWLGVLYTALGGEEPGAEDPPALTAGGDLASEVTLPVLRSHIPAAYPEQALERAIEGEVVLSIAVDEEGRVTGVTLVQGAGHGFDAPAVEAAWSMVFTPALNRRGKHVPAEITYRYTFRMAAVPPLSMGGVVRIRNDKQVLAGALVVAVGPDDQTARTRSDEGGHFRFAALPPGRWVLTVSGQGVRPSSASVDVPAEGYVDDIVLSAELVPTWMQYDEGVSEYVEVTAELRADPAERQISRDVIVTLPGSLGDPMRALQNMPGITRAPFGSGQIAVRGMDTQDTGYFIDGIRVPIVFHFTAVTTVLSADLLTDIDFFPGAWGVRYGRALGGVIDLRTNDDLPERSHSAIGGDIFQLAGFSRLRLGRTTALSLGARRSYLDTLAQPVLAALGATDTDVKLPRYYDAQLHLVQALANNGRFTGTVLLSDDSFRVIGEAGADAVTYRTAFQKGILRHVQPVGRGWSVESSFSVGPESQSLELSDEPTDLAALGIPVDIFGDLPSQGNVVEESSPRWTLRHEWYRAPGDGWLGVRAGVDAAWGRQRLDYSIGAQDPEVGTRPVGMPAAYVEPTVRLGPVHVSPGLRVEVLDLGRLIGVNDTNPRADVALDARLGSTAKFGDTRLTGHLGTFSQPPATRELLGANGPSLTFERSTQASVGITQKLLGDASLGLTVYHSWLRDLVVGRDDVFRFDRATLTPGTRFIPFVNAGTGRAFGAELFGSWITDERIVWLALSLSRALRRDLPQDEPRPATSDQPVNATLIVSQAFDRWRLGARLRYATGPPLTPVLSAVYSTDLQTWVPVYGDPYSERAPAFFALDLRVDRDWWYQKWKLSFYGEVQNATNHRNVEIPGYSEDFTEERSVVGLPIVPVLGLRASW